jgi:nucleotide-binding universal stress UspA family protein
MQTHRHFVVGTDFSEHAEHALDLAIRLADAGAITVVHACELGVEGDDAVRLAECGEALARVLAKHGRQGVELTGVLRTGKPWEKLDNVAVEVGASLIAIGRHGAGRGLNVRLGSVAERLVRSASRPVLTVARHFTGLALEAPAQNQTHEENG